MMGAWTDAEGFRHDAEDREDYRRFLGRRRCECGPDLPGQCPGPNNCPYAETPTRCRVCGEPTRHAQAADDTWICEECAEGDAA